MCLVADAGYMEGQQGGESWRRKEESGGGGGGGGWQEQKSGGEVGGVRKERRGLCAEGPEPRASHPEDLCSLAGWIQKTQREIGERENDRKGGREEEKKTGGMGGKSPWESERTRGRDSMGGLGLIVPLLSLLHVASKGAPAASANFRLARTCELLGAN
ncbi:unnamed protein product [Pleuronectes platessa]|uniref:Uncharacterized protein n=1 Tax=Pleuronectes platessa TaxID=8262 RepID=A0A9N7UU43_PLEPL|nr:unnamed protein product [Pleuronectes platessa]